MSSATDFFDELEDVSRRHRVQHHEFLMRMASERLGLRQLQAFAAQHYLYSRVFARNLAAVIASTPDEDARTLLVLNMYEEIGEPARIRDRVHMLLLEAGLVSGTQLGAALEQLVAQPIDGDVVTLLMKNGVVSRAQVAAVVERNTLRAKDLTHPALFRRFLRALHLNPAELATAAPHPATQQFIDTYHSICRESHWLEALGAMGPGTECIVAGLYARILQGIINSELVSPHDYVFWTLHVHCDDGHGRNIIECMRPYAHEPINQERIARGALRVLDARALWLDALYEHVFVSGVHAEPAAMAAFDGSVLHSATEG
jgi:pyrroloquinoline quinone (PQQ) biosynthesis protein C